MNPRKRVVVATHNAHKIAEIRAIVDLPDWEFVSLGEMGVDEEPLEDADDFVGNARIKARFAHGKTGLAVLADDSGLVVDALGGAPGVYSARYAGENADDTANNAKLLCEMEGLTEGQRTAHFACALVFIDVDGTEIVAEGAVSGSIGHEPRGSNGFGYDPLFYPKTYGHTRTMAELSAAEKNAISHRSLALQHLHTLLVSQSKAPGEEAASPPPVKEIVAFDFDGTLIDASSPVRLINRLYSDGIMPKWNLFKSLLWGGWYKLGLELDQRKPRRYVFGSFKNMPADQANSIMKSVYRDVLYRFLRPEGIEALRGHQAEGKELIIVSASFKPIISELCRDFDIAHFICTQMEVVNGSYTGETLGDPPESEHKLIQFIAWANTTYGKGQWKLTHSYGDHYSDIPLLERAEHPIAIDPDRKLRGIARRRGWEIQDWSLS